MQAMTWAGQQSHESEGYLNESSELLETAGKKENVQASLLDGKLHRRKCADFAFLQLLPKEHAKGTHPPELPSFREVAFQTSCFFGIATPCGKRRNRARIHNTKKTELSQDFEYRGNFLRLPLLDAATLIIPFIKCAGDTVNCGTFGQRETNLAKTDTKSPL